MGFLKLGQGLQLLFFSLFLAAPSFAYKVVTEDFQTIPTTVPAHGMAKIQMRSFRIKESGWLIEAKPTMVNAPGYLLHHGIAVLVPGETSFCGEKFPVNLFWGTGREHETLFLPNGYNLPKNAYGIRVEKGQRVAFFNGAVMLYNPDDVAYKKVQFRITSTFYIPEKGDPPLKDLKIIPLFLTQRPNIYAAQFCPKYQKEVKAYVEKWRKLHPDQVATGAFETTELHHKHPAEMGRMSEHHKKEAKLKGHEHGENGVTFWIPAKTTKKDRWMIPLEIGTNMEIYGVIGHVHDFADYLRIYRNGEPIWNAPLIKDNDGRIVSIPLELKPGIELQAGDKLMLESEYTNPYDVPIDAMAIAVLLVHPEGKGELVKYPDHLSLPKLEEAKK